MSKTHSQPQRIDYYDSVLSGGLYPSLYFNQIGSMYGMKRITNPQYYMGLSGSFSAYYPNVHLQYERQTERFLKCDSCGTPFLLREAADKKNLEPLIALRCSKCGGDLKTS